MATDLVVSVFSDSTTEKYYCDRFQQQSQLFARQIFTSVPNMFKTGSTSIAENIASVATGSTADIRAPKAKASVNRSCIVTPPAPIKTR